MNWQRDVQITLERFCPLKNRYAQGYSGNQENIILKKQTLTTLLIIMSETTIESSSNVLNAIFFSCFMLKQAVTF